MMKRYLSILLAVVLVTLTSCDSDGPEINDTGRLIVNIAQDDSEGKQPDYSDYSIALTPDHGMGWSVPRYSEVSWPIDVKVGTYTISVASPVVTETATTETYYVGEVANVSILKNQTTEITVKVTPKTLPKSH